MTFLRPVVCHDADGVPYFEMELPALRAFGRRIDSIQRQATERLTDVDALDKRIVDARKVDDRRLRDLPPSWLSSLAAPVFISALCFLIDRLSLQGTLKPKKDSSLERVTIRIRFGRRLQPTAQQWNLAEWIQNEQLSLAEEIRNALFSHYRRIYAEYYKALAGDPTRDIVLPSTASASGLDDYVRICELVLHESQSRIECACECTWEDEHGLVVHIESGRAVSVVDA